MSGASPPGGGTPRRVHLRLYIAGTSPRSTRTVESVRRLCDRRLGGTCELEVVDLYQQPGLAGGDGVVAAPTLVRLAPLPARRIAGDLTDERRLLDGLGLREAMPEGGHSAGAVPDAAAWREAGGADAG